MHPVVPPRFRNQESRFVNSMSAFFVAALCLAAAPSTQATPRKAREEAPMPRAGTQAPARAPVGRVQPRGEWQQGQQDEGGERGGMAGAPGRGWQEELRRIVREEVRAALHEAMQQLHGSGHAPGHEGHQPVRELRLDGQTHRFVAPKVDVRVEGPRERVRELVRERLRPQGDGEFRFHNLGFDDFGKDTKTDAKKGGEKGAEKTEKTEKKTKSKDKTRTFVVQDGEPRILRLGGGENGEVPVVLEFVGTDLDVRGSKLEKARKDGEDEECEEVEAQPSPAKKLPARKIVEVQGRSAPRRILI